MKYYTYDVHKVTDTDGDHWDVVETSMDGNATVISTHADEADARIGARYNEEYQKHHNHYLASLATGKWMTINGIQPRHIDVLFFDKGLGVVNTNAAFQAIWRDL